MSAVDEFLEDVRTERAKQDAKWGPQSYPNGTGDNTERPSSSYTSSGLAAENAKKECDEAYKAGKLTWSHILEEEFWEAMAESDPDKLEKELIQVAAVCGAWIEDIRNKRRAKLSNST